MQHVTVRVPASTSNLGPRYDCLGLALQIYNDVRIVGGETDSSPPIVSEAAEKFFERTNSQPFPFYCELAGDVPVARGLGSSATIRVGVLYALNILAETNLDAQQLFALAALLEGHPDNAAPASFGGFTVTRGIHIQRFEVSPRLKFVLLIPELQVATAEARAILPGQISLADAVLSAGNAAAIAATFASGEYEKLRGCFDDRLHQPYRTKLMPFFDNVVAAANNAGALGAFLSGSGSTICALTLANEMQIARAMLAASALGNARSLITCADNEGARIVASNIEHQTSNMR